MFRMPRGALVCGSVSLSYFLPGGKNPPPDHIGTKRGGNSVTFPEFQTEGGERGNLSQESCVSIFIFPRCILRIHSPLAALFSLAVW